MQRTRNWLVGGLLVALCVGSAPIASATETAIATASEGTVTAAETTATGTTEAAATASEPESTVAAAETTATEATAAAAKVTGAQARSAAAQEAVAGVALRELATAASSEASARVGDAIADRLLVTFREDVTVVEGQAVLDAAGVHGQATDGYRVAVVDVQGDPAAAIAGLAAAPQVVDIDLDRLLAFRPAAQDRQPTRAAT
ncbi:MAG: hypothetical protein WD010_09060, partial [Nitriliruptor sp.]